MNLGFILAARALNVSTDLAVRVSLLSAGLWWGGFVTVTFRRLKTRTPARLLASGAS